MCLNVLLNKSYQVGKKSTLDMYDVVTRVVMMDVFKKKEKKGKGGRKGLILMVFVCLGFDGNDGVDFDAAVALF